MRPGNGVARTIDELARHVGIERYVGTDIAVDAHGDCTSAHVTARTGYHRAVAQAGRRYGEDQRIDRGVVGSANSSARAHAQKQHARHND